MYHVIHRYGSGYEYEECCTGTNVHVVMSDVESVHFFEYLKPFRQVQVVSVSGGLFDASFFNVTMI